MGTISVGSALQGPHAEVSPGARRALASPQGKRSGSGDGDKWATMWAASSMTMRWGLRHLLQTSKLLLHAGFHRSPTRAPPSPCSSHPRLPGHKPPAAPSLLLCPRTPKLSQAQLLPLSLGTRAHQRGTSGCLAPASAWESCPGRPGHGCVQDFIGDSPWERGKSRESCTLSFLAWLCALLKSANVNR